MKSSSKINGTIHYLWRAVAQHGNVLDVLVQSRRNALAAKKFFRRLLTGLRYVPRVLVTDKLASYGPAHRVVMPSVEHRQSKYLNIRAENSHQPTRQRERATKWFTSPRHAQRFLSVFSRISPPFRPRRHLLSATGWRHEMAERFTVWNQITGLPRPPPERELGQGFPPEPTHNTRTISPPTNLTVPPCVRSSADRSERLN